MSAGDHKYAAIDASHATVNQATVVGVVSATMDRAQRILAAVRAGTNTVPGIVQMLGMSTNEVRNGLQHLRGEGDIFRFGTVRNPGKTGGPLAIWRAKAEGTAS